MSAEAAGRAPVMTLRQLVDRYLALVSDFDRPVPLSAFGLSREEAQRVFSAFDEDYHISRFLHFSQQPGDSLSVNGVPATHVSLDPQIRSIL